MVADVPVGGFLSGGIDSTIICGIMAQNSNNVRGFNIGFEDELYDESSLANRIADHYGITFESINCTSQTMVEHFEKTAWHIEQPMANPNSIAKVMLSGLVHQNGYKVCLTGEGADELFGGYQCFKLELLWDMIQSTDPNQQQQGKLLLKKFYQIEKRSEGFHWNRDATGRGKLPDYLKRANFYYARMVKSYYFSRLLLTSSLLHQATATTPLQYFEKTFDTSQFKSLSSFNVTRLMTYQQLSQYIIPCIGDRADMANSLETRLAFLDPELVEFAHQIPPEHFIDINTLKEKNLLRVGFKELLPDFMEQEHKHPFMAPNWYQLYKTEMGFDLFHSMLDSQLIQEVGIFRHRAIGDDGFPLENFVTAVCVVEKGLIQ